MTGQDIIDILNDDLEKGFRILMKKYREPVYWHIRRIVVSHEDAADATQETFVRVFRNIQNYNPDKSLDAWIYRIATNEALRAKERMKDSMPLDKYVNLWQINGEPYTDLTNEATVRLQQAILTLPEKQQLAFNMRYYDNMSFEDIAEVIGSTWASVKVAYHLATKKIKNYIKENT